MIFSLFFIYVFFWMSTVQHPILLLWNETKRRCHCSTSTVWYHCSQTVPYLQELPDPDDVNSRGKVMNFMWLALGEQTGLLSTSVSFLVVFIWPCIFFFSLSLPRRWIYRSHDIYFAKGQKEIRLILSFYCLFQRYFNNMARLYIYKKNVGWVKPDQVAWTIT